MAATVTPPRASTDPSPARYHVVATDGNHVQIHQISMRTSQNATVTTNFLVITDGGNRITISQQNAADLAPALTNFGTNGVLS